MGKTVSEWEWALLLAVSLASLLIWTWDKIKNGKDD